LPKIAAIEKPLVPKLIFDFQFSILAVLAIMAICRIANA